MLAGGRHEGSRFHTSAKAAERLTRQPIISASSPSVILTSRPLMRVVG